jgi:hypothetical protein
VLQEGEELSVDTGRQRTTGFFQKLDHLEFIFEDEVKKMGLTNFSLGRTVDLP